MRNWSKGLPDDVEPRLWLVDHLLENEETEEAKPHVDWLATARQDDPRVRATPWKWQLLEAMRLSRRKAWLSRVPERLEEAESQWPTWLSKQWLPYLNAALALRCGKTDEFEQQRKQICSESGIAQGLAGRCLHDAGSGSTHESHGSRSQAATSTGGCGREEHWQACRSMSC